MSNEQEMREAFEKWVATKYQVYEGVFATKDGEYYRHISPKDDNDFDADVQSLFVCYQAATIAAEARIRELEADAERVDWIEKHGYGIRSKENGHKNLVLWFHEGNVRQAVDRAIAEHKENQG